MNDNNNKNVSIFDSISYISKENKIRLIKEIRKNLSLNSSENVAKTINNIKSDSTTDNAPEIDSFLSDSFLRESLLVKTWISFLGFFQNKKNKEEVYKFYLLRKIESDLNSVYRNPVVSLKKETFRAGFLEMILNIYLPINQLKEFFKMIEKGNSVVEQTMFEIIQEKVPNAKSQVQNILDLDVYESYLKKEKSQNDLEDSIKDRIDLYLKTIPLNTYKDVENRFAFYYILNSLAFFPYKSFFSFFNLDLFDTDEVPKKISFVDVHDVSFSNISKYVNYLFDILHTLSDLEIDEDLLREIITNYFKTANNQNDNNKDEINIKIESVLKKVNILIKKILILVKNSPYALVFKIYHKNPIAKPQKYIPYFDVKGFYENILLLNTHSEVVKNCKPSLTKLINQEISFLIKDVPLVLNINENLFKGQKLNYNFRKVYFLNEFFKNTYDIKLSEIVKITNNSVLINSSEIRAIYVSLENNINSLEKEISNLCFDLKYKNEEYLKLKKDNKIDDTYEERLDRWCLNQFNLSNEYVSRFLDYFIILKKNYLSLLDNSNSFIQNSLNSSYKSYDLDDKNTTLSDAIRSLILIIDKAIFVISNL